MPATLWWLRNAILMGVSAGSFAFVADLDKVQAAALSVGIWSLFGAIVISVRYWEDWQ